MNIVNTLCTPSLVRKSPVRGEGYVPVILTSLTVHLRQALLSLRFVLCILGTCLVLFMTSYGLISPMSDVVSIVLMSGGGNMILILALLPLIPYATTLASDWEQHAHPFWLIRSGVTHYVMGKMLAGAISAFLTTFLGILLYAVFLLFQLPLFTHISTGDAYAVLLEQNMPIIYILARATHLSMSSMLFACLAIWVSVLIPNRFVTLVAPIVIYFMMFRLTRFWGLPDYLNIPVIIEGTYDAGSAAASLITKCVTIFIPCLLLGFGAMKLMRRRIGRE